MADPVDRASTDPVPPGDPVPPAPRRRWRRILLVALLTVVVLAGLLLLLLPTLLSTGFVRSRIEEKAREASGRFVSLGGHSVGWSESGLRDLVVRRGPSPDDPVVVRVAEVKAAAGITTALSSRYDVGRIVILRPEVRIDLLGRTETPPEAPAPGDAGGGAGAPAGEPRPVPPFSVRVEVREGALLAAAPGGKERRIGTFTADLAASSDGPAEVSVSLDLGASGRARLKARTTPFENGKPLPAEALRATLEAVLEGLDLAAFRDGIPAAGGLELAELAGVVDGTVSVREAGGDGTGAGEFSLGVRGLRASGRFRGRPFRVEEPTLEAAGGFGRSGDGALEVREGLLRARDLEGRASLSLRPDGTLTGTASGKASIAALLERVQGFGLLPETKALGEVSLEARALGDAKAQRFTGSLRVTDAQVSPGPGRAPIDEPSSSADFDVVREGGSIRIDAATLRSGSLVAEARGRAAEDLTSADLSVTAKVQVARVARIASGFGFSLPGEVAGVAELQARLRRGAGPGAGDEATGTLVITDFAVRLPGEEAWAVREPRLEAAFEAVPGEREVEIRSLTLKGAGAEVLVRGRAALDGTTGSLETLESSADLGKALAVAEALRGPLPARVSGTVSWKGPLSWKERFGTIGIPGGRLAASDLAVTLPAAGGSPERVFREDSVAATLAAVLTRRADGSGYDAEVGEASLSAAGLEVKGRGRAAADGAVDLEASGTAGIAECLRRAAGAGFLPKSPSTPGRISFDLAAKGRPPDLRVEVRRFEARDAEFRLAGSGAFEARGAASVAFEGGGDLGKLLDLAAGAGYGPGAKGASGAVAARIEAKAGGAESPLGIAMDASVSDLRWPDPAGGPTWTQKSLRAVGNATVDRKAGSAAVDAVLSGDDGTSRIRGTVADFAGPARSVDLAADLDLDLSGLCRARPDLMPLPEMVVGKVKGTAHLRGPLPGEGKLDPAKLTGDLKATLDSVRTRPFELEDAALDAVLQGGTVAARSLAATVNGGKVTATAALGLQGIGAKHFLEARAEGVRIEPAMAWLLEKVVPVFAAAEKGGVTGLLKAELRLDAEGPDWAAAKAGLKGAGNLTVTDGAVKGSGVLADVLELLGGGKGITFSNISTGFSVHDRKVWNERLTVDGKDHSMVLRGATGFDGKLDYRLGAKSLKMSAKRRERLAPLLDEDGNLPFRLAGTLDSPKVRAPDLKKVLGGAAEDLLRKLLGGKDE